MKNNLPQRTVRVLLGLQPLTPTAYPLRVQSAQRKTVAPHVRATVELSVFSVAKGCSYDK